MSLIQGISRGVRQISSSSTARCAARTKNIAPGYFQLKKVQERFQVKDGKPVFLKGGVMDNILYRITMGLCLVGLGGIGKLFYELSNPRND